MKIPKRHVDFYGDQTRWFVGSVVSLQDPFKVGRIQVRIQGIHSDDLVEIPDEKLPWAQVVAPITEGGTNGLHNALGVQPGALVFGIFLDGQNSQLPLIFGSLPKLETESEVSSLSPEAQNTDYNGTKLTTIHDSKTPDSVTGEDQLPNPYGAVYPDNKVTKTRSGHVIEIDDSEGKERIHIYHKSGTFIEMHESGDVVTHHKNGFRTVTGNDKLHVTGNLNIVADGHITMDGKTINLNSGTQGAARIGDTADVGDDPPGISGSDGSNVIETGSGTVFIGD